MPSSVEEGEHDGDNPNRASKVAIFFLGLVIRG